LDWYGVECNRDWSGDQVAGSNAPADAQMLSSGLKELSSFSDILFLYERFQCQMSDTEAAAFFCEVIASSLAGKTLKFNHTWHVIWHGLLK
jgi:hypothetical protein